MPKRISVDAALLDHRPYIQFRGVDYVLRDATVREAAERMVRFRAEWEEAERREQAARDQAAEDERDVDVRELAQVKQDIQARTLMEALEDFPEDVATAVTDREYRLLEQAITQARALTLPETAVEDVKEADLKRAGEAAAG